MCIYSECAWLPKSIKNYILHTNMKQARLTAQSPLCINQTAQVRGTCMLCVSNSNRNDIQKEKWKSAKSRSTRIIYKCVCCFGISFNWYK